MNPEINDFRQLVRSKTTHLTLIYADVTRSAKTLESNHLCGPTAGLIQAEALTGVAMLADTLSQPEETLTIRFDVDGPIRGLLVEAHVKGTLRGYTKVKVMNDLDGMERPDTAQALGATGRVEIIRSLPGRILSSAVSEVYTPSVSRALEKYFADSLQQGAAVSLHAATANGYLASARGLLLLEMPDSDPSAFARIKALFEGGEVDKLLARALPLPDICRALALDDPVYADPVPLRFSCRCSMERIEKMLGGLPLEELEELSKRNEPTRIYCHLCGKDYTVEPERIREIIRARQEKKGE